MKVLLINGSPRDEGSTGTVLNVIAEQLEQDGIGSRRLNIGKEPIGGCIACRGCMKKGRCVVKGEIVQECIDAMREADGVIIGTPVYYAGANGSLTSMLDRVFYSDIEKRFAYKPGAAVAIARRGGTISALDRINKYFSISRMPVVSSQYWNMVYGAGPEDVVQDLEGIQIVQTLAQNMAWLLKCIDHSKEAFPPPEFPAPARTNFIR